MTSTPEGPGHSLHQIARLLWRRRWLALLVAGLTFALLLWAMIPTRPVWSVRMTVAPAPAIAGAEMPAGAFPLSGGLAGILGSRLGAAQPALPFDRYLALLNAATLARALERNTEGGVIARFWPELHDEAGRYQPPEGPLAAAKAQVNALFGEPAWRPPTPEAFAEALARALRIRAPIDGAPLRELRLDHSDAAFAAELLARLHETADRMLREEQRARLAAQLDYVTARLAATTQIELRSGLVQVVLQLERGLMALAADQPYAADLVAPPTISFAPVWPKPMLAVLLAVLAALALGLVAAFLAEALRAAPRPPGAA